MKDFTTVTLTKTDTYHHSAEKFDVVIEEIEAMSWDDEFKVTDIRRKGFGSVTVSERPERIRQLIEYARAANTADDLTGLDERGSLADQIREQQVKTSEALVDVDKAYAEVLDWWRQAKPVFVDKAAADDITIGRTDCVSIVMYTLANNHPPTDLALMLATKVVDEEAAGND